MQNQDVHKLGQMSDIPLHTRGVNCPMFLLENVECEIIAGSAHCFESIGVNRNSEDI
jgi:hypothetical protein